MAGITNRIRGYMIDWFDYHARHRSIVAIQATAGCHTAMVIQGTEEGCEICSIRLGMARVTFSSGNDMPYRLAYNSRNPTMTRGTTAGGPVMIHSDYGK